MTGKEKCLKEIKPYIDEGLMRVVFETDWFLICNIIDATYGMFLFDEVDPKSGLTCMFNLRMDEFEQMVKNPTRHTFKTISYNASQGGIHRTFVCTPNLMRKFRDIKHDSDPENPDIDPEKERSILESLNKKKKRGPTLGDNLRNAFFGGRRH